MGNIKIRFGIGKPNRRWYCDFQPQFKADAQDDDGTLVTVEFYDTDATVTPTQTETQSASKSKAVSQ